MPIVFPAFTLTINHLHTYTHCMQNKKLRYAALCGDVTTAAVLLDAGANVNTTVEYVSEVVSSI